jgi:hypothetical protein
MLKLATVAPPGTRLIGADRPHAQPGASPEVFLVMKEFRPSFTRGGDMAMDGLAGDRLAALRAAGRDADDFEPTRVGGKPTAGIMNNVVVLGGFQEAEFDFLADCPGPTLFHCHQQLHMDFGFMALFTYAWGGVPWVRAQTGGH